MSAASPIPQRRAPKSSSEGSASASNGTASAASQQGAAFRRPGMRGEVKLAIMLVVTLATAFGYVVHRKFDMLKQNLAAAEKDSFHPLVGSIETGEVQLGATSSASPGVGFGADADAPPPVLSVDSQTDAPRLTADAPELAAAGGPPSQADEPTFIRDLDEPAFPSVASSVTASDPFSTTTAGEIPPTHREPEVANLFGGEPLPPDGTGTAFTAQAPATSEPASSTADPSEFPATAFTPADSSSPTESFAPANSFIPDEPFVPAGESLPTAAVNRSQPEPFEPIDNLFGSDDPSARPTEAAPAFADSENANSLQPATPDSEPFGVEPTFADAPAETFVPPAMAAEPPAFAASEEPFAPVFDAAPVGDVADFAATDAAPAAVSAAPVSNDPFAPIPVPGAVSPASEPSPAIDDEPLWSSTPRVPAPAEPRLPSPAAAPLDTSVPRSSALTAEIGIPDRAPPTPRPALSHGPATFGPDSFAEPEPTIEPERPSLFSDERIPARPLGPVLAEPEPTPDPMPSEPFPITATAEPGFPAPGLVSSLSEPAFNPEPVNVTPGADHAGLPDIAYNVRPGDNYWSISKHHYGTVRYFAALGEYNKNRIQDPAHLKPGMKVLVPHPNVLETRYPKLFEGMSPAPQSTGIQPASQQTSEGFFVDADGVPRYRVGKGDTLTDIAQKHLGRASRWTQIHGLNRDLLPTPDRVRPGLVLELPRDASQIAPIP